ncbi:MAG: hypothetical protein HDT39_16125 [Lachnospiraceae bacterium]|nr:hypothetical protein [Lachnospiraceae bacterium]
MLGYYDGIAVQTLEKIQAKKNQKLIITILDKFIDELPEVKIHSARGSLSKYAIKNVGNLQEKSDII